MAMTLETQRSPNPHGLMSSVKKYSQLEGSCGPFLLKHLRMLCRLTYKVPERVILTGRGFGPP